MATAPLQAQTFFDAWSSDRVGVAVEIQRDTLAGVMVSQPAAGQAVATSTFAGDLLRERSGGDTPFTTQIVDSAAITLEPVAGAGATDGSYMRVRGVGTDRVELQAGGDSVVLLPLGFDVALTLADWAGRHLLLRTTDDGQVDATAIDFMAVADVDGTPALVGTAVDGRAGLLMHDVASGVVVGAYEVAPGQAVAFALFGTRFDTDRAEGVWVASGADGRLLGGDRMLQVLRIAATADLRKSVAVPSMLRAPATQALEQAVVAARHGSGGRAR